MIDRLWQHPIRFLVAFKIEDYVGVEFGPSMGAAVDAFYSAYFEQPVTLSSEDFERMDSQGAAAAIGKLIETLQQMENTTFCVLTYIEGDDVARISHSSNFSDDDAKSELVATISAAIGWTSIG